MFVACTLVDTLRNLCAIGINDAAAHSGVRSWSNWRMENCLDEF
jgi:hypothetical protein